MMLFFAFFVFQTQIAAQTSSIRSLSSIRTELANWIGDTDMSVVAKNKENGCISSKKDTKAVILNVSCFASYFFYGACYSSLGAALPALAARLGVSTSAFGIAFTTRGIGFLCGTLLSGYINHSPKINWSKPLLAAIFLLVNALMLFIIARATSFTLVVLMFIIQGVGFGGIDMMLNCAIPEIWGPARAQPWLQATYTFFGTGAILGPILVGLIGYQMSFYVFAVCCFTPILILAADHFYVQSPMIDEHTGETITPLKLIEPVYDESRPRDANHVVPNFPPTLIGAIARGNNFETMRHRRPSHKYHLRYIAGRPHAQTYTNVDNVRIPHHMIHDHNDRNQPHSAPASLKVLTSAADSHLHEHKHHHTHKHNGKHSGSDNHATNIDSTSAAATDIEANNHDHENGNDHDQDTTTEQHALVPAAVNNGTTAPPAVQPTDNKAVLSNDEPERKVVKTNKPLPVVVMVLVMLFYVCISPLYSYGGWVSTYAIQAGVTSSDSQAAFLPSIFWAAMAAGRFTSIFLALHFTATRMIRIKLVLLAVFTSTLMAVADSSYTTLCIMSALFGYGLSTIYPLGITIVGDYGFVADEHSTFFFILASNTADCWIPLCIGLLMQGVGAQSLIVAIFIAAFVMIGIYCTMNYISRGIQKANVESDLALIHAEVTAVTKSFSDVDMLSTLPVSPTDNTTKLDATKSTTVTQTTSDFV